MNACAAMSFSLILKLAQFRDLYYLNLFLKNTMLSFIVTLFNRAHGYILYIIYNYNVFLYKIILQ